jgi:HD-GYP domain-containing protein (c-di-GMP phosphodiesterase class II)
VVDSFDAMTSDRPYRAGMPVEKAIEILGDGAGTQWDAQLIDAFLKILPDIMDIRGNYRRPPLPSRKPSDADFQQESLVGGTAH